MMRKPLCYLSRDFLQLILSLATGIALAGEPHSACANPTGTTGRTTAPISLTDRHNLVLADFTVADSPGNAILLRSCSDVVIANVSVLGAAGEAVHLIDCTSITITGCTMSDVRTSVYAVNSRGVRVVRNSFRNMKGPMPRGQFVQFNNVSGEGNLIADNTGINVPGQSHPEDAISIFNSHGTPESPIVIKNNRIRGGGPSLSGGGIMAGDNGGSHIVVDSNVLVDPGQYGIAVAGGNHITITSNTIIARQQPFTNVGLYVWNQSAEPCGQISIRNNRVSWIDKHGNRNPAWNAGNCGPITGWDQNDWNADPGAAGRSAGPDVLGMD